ncbi:MAG TPA: helix-turn-helix transcriptional regulator [Ktedonobacteraceae bacterium]
MKVERIKHGWTQAEVAETVGVDARTVSRWERGKLLWSPVLIVEALIKRGRELFL